MGSRLNVHNMAAWVGSLGLFIAFVAFWLGSSEALLVGVGLAFGVVGAAMWVWNLAAGQRHREEYRTFAREHGWDYVPSSVSYVSRFTGFPFETGSQRRQTDVLTGAYSGLRCATFTHEFDTSSENDASSIPQSYQVTLAELDVRLPRLDIVPESLGNRLAQALGGVDVEMESYEFNRRWRVKCSDRRYAMDVVDPRMMERLMGIDMEGVAIRIEGGAVLIWSAGRQGTADLSGRLGIVASIARRIPDHVLRQFREAGYGIQAAPGPGAPLRGPSWATQGGVLNSRHYTGIGMDADGDGIDDAAQGPTRASD